TRIVSRVDVIDRPRPNAMDLKDGLFLGPGEVVHLRLHNRHTAGRYSLGLGGIKLVSHADVKGAGDHSYVLDRGVRVPWNFVVRRKLNAEGERHGLIQRSLNDGNLRARWQRRHVSPFKIRGRNKRVSLSRICWRDQKDAKSSQKSGCYCNGFHGFLLRWVSEILMTHGRLPGGAPSVRGFEKSCLAPRETRNQKDRDTKTQGYSLQLWTHRPCHGRTSPKSSPDHSRPRTAARCARS